MLLPTALLAMPAPCCLRWALPRPPEWLPRLWLLVLVLLVAAVSGGTRGDQCALGPRAGPSDGASRAYLAPQVVEAQLYSATNSSSRVYEAIFYVTRSYKKYRGYGRIKKKQMVSFPFRRPGPPVGRFAAVKDCLAVADLKLKRKYFLFLSGSKDPTEPVRNVAPPVQSSKKSKKRIRNITCNQCAKAPTTVGSLKGDTVVTGQTVNLTCIFDGNPPPIVTWYKDDQLIRPRQNNNTHIYTKRLRIKSKKKKKRVGRRIRNRRENRRKLGSRGSAGHKRRKSKRRKNHKVKPVQVVSVLSIKESRIADTGVYMCSGKSVVGETSSKATLTVVTSMDPGFVHPCPMDKFCLNGGTCMFFKHFGEYVCVCAEGYKGHRCDKKEVYPRLRDHNCHGSSTYYTASRGLRCPRNQPKFIWEILQQSLSAQRHKVSLWSKANHLKWSPGQKPWRATRGWIRLTRLPFDSRRNSTSKSNGTRKKGPLLPPFRPVILSNDSVENRHFLPPSVKYQKYFSQIPSVSKFHPKPIDIKFHSAADDKSEILEKRLRYLSAEKAKASVREKKLHSLRHHRRTLPLDRPHWGTKSSVAGRPTTRRSYIYPTSIVHSIPTSLGRTEVLN